MYVHTNTIIVYFTSYSFKSNFMVRVPLSGYDNNNYASPLWMYYYCMYIGMIYLP